MFPPKVTLKSSFTVNAAVPALFCTKSDVVADVEPLPLIPTLAPSDVVLLLNVAFPVAESNKLTVPAVENLWSCAV